MYRHHPQWQKTKELVTSGAIGTLTTIQSYFAFFNRKENDIRNSVEAGGGSLMDIGCYCISLSRFLFGEEPQRVNARVERDPDFGTDKLTSGILEFSAGTSTFTCSTQTFLSQRVTVFGSDGRIEIEIPFNAPPDRPTRLWHTTSAGTEEITFDICDQYTIQGDLFAGDSGRHRSPNAFDRCRPEYAGDRSRLRKRQERKLGSRRVIISENKVRFRLLPKLDKWFSCEDRRPANRSLRVRGRRDF